MMRTRLWCLLCAVAAVGASMPASAQTRSLPQLALDSRLQPVAEVAPDRTVELHGVVRDDQGKPLRGAVVSAVGSRSAFAVSDHEGRFLLRDLAPGPYLVRAHLPDYVQARGRVVHVAPGGRTTSTIQLARKPGPESETLTVLAASIGGVDEAEPESVDPSETATKPESQDELAWRLRHLKRSVLKDVQTSLAGLDEDGSLLGDPIATLSRAVGDSARLASSLLADLSVSGQFNLLTSTSFDRPQDLFTLNGNVPHGIAFLALEGPGASGDWKMRGTMTQGDLASWILAGSYVRHRPATHAYEAGVSYGMQRYLGGNGQALAAIRDGSRNVGSVYAIDHWTVTPQLRVSYGAKYAKYDYLVDQGLVSPRVSFTVQPDPNDSLTLRATIRRREIAPGAEEFLPPSTGLWLPPERTFSQVSQASFVPERHDQIEVAVDREYAGRFVVGVRVFRESVEDQVATLFGVALGEAPADIGHYQVASAGDFGAHGWGVGVSHAFSDHLKAAVDYTQARTEWRRRSSDLAALSRLAASVIREGERIHDVTASVESELQPTATRVFVIYKVNTALAASEAALVDPAAGVRFDVQVNQALPFLNFSSARWEMLVAVSNLFKEDLLEGSVYDELLVVRPPKRIVGGVTVRF